MKGLDSSCLAGYVVVRSGSQLQFPLWQLYVCLSDESATSTCPLYALILTPTRELAIQTRDHIQAVTKYTDITVRSVTVRQWHHITLYVCSAVWLYLCSAVWLYVCSAVWLSEECRCRSRCVCCAGALTSSLPHLAVSGSSFNR